MPSAAGSRASAGHEPTSTRSVSGSSPGRTVDTAAGIASACRRARTVATRFALHLRALHAHGQPFAFDPVEEGLGEGADDRGHLLGLAPVVQIPPHAIARVQWGLGGTLGGLHAVDVVEPIARLPSAAGHRSARRSPARTRRCSGWRRCHCASAGSSRSRCPCTCGALAERNIVAPNSRVTVSCTPLGVGPAPSPQPAIRPAAARAPRQDASAPGNLRRARDRFSAGIGRLPNVRARRDVQLAQRT